MRIVYKLLLAIALPVALIWAVGIHAAGVSQQSLTDAIEETSSLRAREIMDEIDRLVAMRVADWRAYLRSVLVKQALQESNKELADTGDPLQTIIAREQDWQSDSQAEWIKDLLNNKLSVDLRARLEALEEEAGYPVFGEVFLTNEFGGNAAQTSMTSDYRQDDEDWWQGAVRDGIYIGDVEFDDSARIYSVDICLPVNDEGKLLGVVKAVMNIRETHEIIDRRAAGRTSGGRLILLNTDKQVIHEANLKGRPLQPGDEFFQDWDPAAGSQQIRLTDSETNEELLASFAVSRKHRNFPGMGWIVLDARIESDVLQPVRRLRSRMFWLSLLATVIVVTISGAISRSITRPLRRLLDGTERLGAGELDHRIPVRSEDEIGRLGAAFNDMAEKLQLMVHDMKDKETKLREQYETLEEQSKTLASQEETLAAQAERDKLFDAIRDAVTRLTTGCREILTTTSQQKTGSQEQLAAVSQTVSTVDEVAQIARDTNQRAADVASDARRTEDVAKTSRQAVLNSIDVMDQVQSEVESIAGSIVALAERATKIGEITATVNDIAEQTNVLALNAAVEASRAGEHGQGFAVVAAEIKQLAQQAKNATQQVRQNLVEIQDATSKAVHSTESGTEAVSKASKVAQQTAQSIRKLLELISQSARNAAQISASASEQASGLAQLNQAMKKIEGVTAETVEGVARVEQSAHDLSSLSGELADLTA